MKVKALVFSTALLLAGQAAANAGQELPRLTPAQVHDLSRDLLPPYSQDFFRKGQDLIEREAQILRQRQTFSTKPVLKIDPMPQVKENHLHSNSSQETQRNKLCKLRLLTVNC